MTEKGRKELVVIINTEIEKLQEKILELKEFTQPVSPDNAIGRVSRMDAINNKSIYEASMRNSKKRLELLRHTLKTINDKGFGICFKCKQSIPFERLKLRPEVKICANCVKR